MWLRLASLALGLLFCCGFIALDYTVPGLQIGFYPDWTNSTPGELYFWLASVFVATPGALLLGFGLAPWLAGPARRLWRWAEALPPAGLWRLALLAGLLALLAAVVGRELVLLGRPVTDDEHMARLGGQVLAGGRWMVPLPAGWEAFPQLFLHVREGLYTSMDWLGGHLAWALAELTGTDSLLFSAAAAVPFVFVPLTVARLLGPGMGLVGLLLLVLSPMAATLSLTAHAHLLSRAWLSVALYLFVRADSGARRWHWPALGFSLGAALLCRPFESVFLCTPLLLWLAWRWLRGERQLGLSLAGIVAGAVAPLALFAWSNWQVTGNPLVPPRFFSPGEEANLAPVVREGALLVRRLGRNLLHNELMLSLWFLGPLGLPLALFGFWRERKVRLLGAGVLSLLGLAMLHDDPGLHIVGPIHYSESVLFLVPLAAAGLRELRSGPWLAGVDRARFAVVVAVGLAVSLTLFTSWHCRALRRQAVIHETIYSVVDSPSMHGTVVMAPPYNVVWRMIPDFLRVGTFVFEWRRVHPDGRDNAVIVHDHPELEGELRRQFPDREFYVLELQRSEPYMRLRLLPEEGAQ